jgi:hypothetical protein
MVMPRNTSSESSREVAEFVCLGHCFRVNKFMPANLQNLFEMNNKMLKLFEK